MTLDMRVRFIETTAELLRHDPRLALVLADVGDSMFRDARAPSERVLNVGIREQLMVGVASGLALTGFRPIVHTIATFVTQRAYEQLKLDLGHQGVGAIVVAHGASYDYAESGRTHQAPEDVALVSSLPGWEVHVPGHPDEVAAVLRRVATGDGLAYVRLSVQSNASAHADGVVRGGTRGTVIAVGPMLDRVLVAVADLDVTVIYASRVRPFDADMLRRTLTVPDVAIVEPYQQGTSSAEIARALGDVPHRLLAIGVPNVEYRSYGTLEDHDRAHGLDAASLRARIGAFFAR